MRSVDDDFNRRGQNFGEAREILLDGCEIPPSFEVFEQQLDEATTRGERISPQTLAYRISSRYRRIRA